MKKAVIYIGILSLFVIGTFVEAHTLGDGFHTIHITENGFEPNSIEIQVGDTVIFENVDTIGRWPASNIHPTHTVYPGSDIRDCGTDTESQMFDACRELNSGEAYAFTFTVPGEWRYHDHVIANHTGEVTVVGDVDRNESIEESRGFFSWVGDQFRALFSFFSNTYKRAFSDLNEISVVEVSVDDDALADVLKVYGAAAVMNKLLEETEGGSVFDCHQEAHQVGRMAYRVFGAKAFEEGDASCHSGYYHGAMEAFLSEEGTNNLAQNIAELCSIFSTQFGIFECLHGVGHGVLAYENYDLPTSLDACDQLDTHSDARACYGGVFMENVVTGQGLGAIPGHETGWLSEDDPHFPCDAVGDSYGRRYDCYQMQTSWMLTLSGYDFATVAEQCLDAPEDMVSVCYKSYGRDAAGTTLRDPQKTLALCDLVPKNGRYYEQCVEGGVNVIIDFWGPKLEEQANEFCAMVIDPSAQEHCYAIIDSRTPGLFGI